MHEHHAMYLVHEIDRDAAPAGALPDGVLRRVGAAFAAWRLHRVERRCMADLDDRMLADIGRDRPVPPPPALRLDRSE